MASPFTVTLATQWIADGTAADMLNAIRNESRARQAIASRMLEAWPYEAHQDGFHLWLPVPMESSFIAIFLGGAITAALAMVLIAFSKVQARGIDTVEARYESRAMNNRWG